MLIRISPRNNPSRDSLSVQASLTCTCFACIMQLDMTREDILDKAEGPPSIKNVLADVVPELPINFKKHDRYDVVLLLGGVSSLSVICLSTIFSSSSIPENSLSPSPLRDIRSLAT